MTSQVRMSLLFFVATAAACSLFRYPFGQPSLSQRLEATIDPGPGRTVLSRRLKPTADNVCVHGTIVKDLSASTLPTLRDYADFVDDTDLTFSIDLDPSSKALVEKLTAKPLKDVLHCEAVPFARKRLATGELAHVFPGWRESGKWSIRFNSKAFWTDQPGAQHHRDLLQIGTKVRVRGALVTDLVSGGLEIHPIYEIDLQ